MYIYLCSSVSRRDGDWCLRNNSRHSSCQRWQTSMLCDTTVLVWHLAKMSLLMNLWDLMMEMTLNKNCLLSAAPRCMQPRVLCSSHDSTALRLFGLDAVSFCRNWDLEAVSTLTLFVGYLDWTPKVSKETLGGPGSLFIYRNCGK